MTTPGPTVVNDIADLYRILDEQPQWKEALRYQLLGSELLAGPERLDELTAGIRELRQTASQLAETAAANTRQCVELRETTTAQTRQFVELRETVSQLAETAAANTRQIAELRETTDAQTRQIAELRETAADHTLQLADHTRQCVELRETVSQLRETAADHTRQLAEQTRQFVELRETVSQLAETAAEHTRQIAELRETADAQTRQFVELRETAAENTRQIVELRRITTNQTTRMNRMENDMSGVKGMKFEYRIERTCVIVANALELANPEMIPTAELLRFANQLGLEASTKDSFIQADLVFLGQDQEDTPHYAAVEISWTVGQWDIDRARRNAALIEQATGIPALAGAAGTRCEDQLDWSEVAWVRLIA